MAPNNNSHLPGEGAETETFRKAIVLIKEVTCMEVTCSSGKMAVSALEKAEDMRVFNPAFYHSLNKEMGTNFLFKANQPTQNKAYLKEISRRLSDMEQEIVSKEQELKKLESELGLQYKFSTT